MLPCGWIDVSKGGFLHGYGEIIRGYLLTWVSRYGTVFVAVRTEIQIVGVGGKYLSFMSVRGPEIL